MVNKQFVNTLIVKATDRRHMAALRTQDEFLESLEPSEASWEPGQTTALQVEVPQVDKVPNVRRQLCNNGKC